MPNTITSFTVFAPGTKARSSEANTNFSNYRGDIIPINPDTASASDNTHNLGSSEHRWAVGYLASVDYRGMTTTSALQASNLGDTAGGWQLKIGSMTLSHSRIGEFGFQGNTTTNYTMFQYQSGVTAGALDLLMGAATLASFTTDGMKHRTLAPMEYTTTSAPIGTAILIASTSATLSLPISPNTTLCSARLIAKGGGVIMFGFVNQNVGITGATQSSDGGTQTWAIQFRSGPTTTSMSVTANFNCFAKACAASTSGLSLASYAPMAYTSGYSPGEVVLEAIIAAAGTSQAGTLKFTGRFFAKEL